MIRWAKSRTSVVSVAAPLSLTGVKGKFALCHKGEDVLANAIPWASRCPMGRDRTERGPQDRPGDEDRHHYLL